VTERAPTIETQSYATDEAFLRELREAWPPLQRPDGDRRGFMVAGVDARPPVAALRLGDRFGVALLAETAETGGFHVLPVARDPLLVTSWRQAIAGDGLSAFVAGVPAASERAIAADQTNASVVVGERAIVKWFRSVGPGPSRASLLLAHLDAAGFREMPTPLGSLAWRRADGSELTIAQGDAFLPGAVDGWEWCLARLERHVAHGHASCLPDCDPWIGAPLGRLTARLHAALRTPSPVLPDPIGRASPDVVAGWRSAAQRTLDEAIALPAAADDRGFSVAPIVASMRAELDGLPIDRPIEVQPVHGDLHVGQVLEWAGGLAVIDFDGNPALGEAGNAVRQPVERDIAQMLTSLDHLGRIVDRRTGGRRREIVDEWIARTHREFLETLDADPALLAAFEVEQECRELVYAARFLPRWRYAPLATLRARYGG
jgi:maltokinase